VIQDLKRKRVCPNCSQRYHSKDAGTHTVSKTAGDTASNFRDATVGRITSENSPRVFQLALGYQF